MEFEVRGARNGIILKDEEGEIVFQQDADEGEHEAWLGFLRTLTDMYGPCEGKYSEKRIYINIAPGCDYVKPKNCKNVSKDWSELVCPLCDRPPYEGEFK